MSMTTSNSNTDNVFARLLSFYEKYRRSKLNASVLQVCDRSI